MGSRQILRTSEPPILAQGIGSDNALLPIPDPAPADAAADGSKEADITYIKNLYDIHMILVQHPLYDDNSVASRARGGSCARTSDLQLGRLFEMTTKLKGLTRHATSMEGIDPFACSPRDKVMALLALSCYTGFSHAYGLAANTLREMQISGQKLDESHQLMSGLTVDGFSLGGGWDFQLNFVVNLCEQIRQRLERTIDRLRSYV